MPLPSGTRLGVYEVVAPLGAGGMGEVYEAKDSRLGRSVALKLLPDALASDADRVARLEREARVLAALNHPHIASLHGMEHADGRLFLVMELVDGETLEEKLRHGSGLMADGKGREDGSPSAIRRQPSRGLPVSEALAIARQIAAALEAAHDKGIVHRDLKPANVKVTSDDNVKVLDFGLAKAMSGDTAVDSAAGLSHSPTLTFAGATHAGMILGTAPYMSPEQAKGRTADKRSDVWAFGCVLYEMLAGRRAFSGEDVSDTLASVLKDEPDWSALPQAVPHGVRALIQGCLKKDRKERVGDISTALFLMNQPHAMAVSTAAGQAAAPPLWRRALPIAGGTAIGAVAVAALLWRPQASTPLPVTRFAIALPEGQQFTLVRRAVDISPDGRQIAYAAGGRLFLRSMGDNEPRLVSGPDEVIGPVFSPNGESVAFWSPVGSTLKRVPVGGGTPVTLGPAGQTPSGIDWSSSGILFAQPGIGIIRIPESGGKPDVVIPVAPTEALAHGPQELPGGLVLFTVARRSGNQFSWDQGQIVVQSLKTGERKTIVDGASDGRYIPTGHLVYAVSGTIFAVPFDVRKLEVTGSAAPIVEGIARATSISGGAAQFAFSQTGSLVYLAGPASAGRHTVLMFDRKGTVEDLKLPGNTYGHPRVSPDGKRLALETGDGKETSVSIYELAGTTSVRRLTFGGSNRLPLWSPDGRHVAFQSDRDGDNAVFWQPPDGGIAERLTKPATGAAHMPESWSPDGETLLYSEAKGPEYSLWMLSLRDRKAVQFPDVRSLNFPPEAVMSPDGRWVAYQIGEANQGEGMLYVQPFPPTGTKYQIARGGRPAWSRDGTELFYVPAPGQFMGVTVATTPTFSFGNPTAIPRRFGVADPVSPRPYDVMTDGRFVGVGVAGQIGSSGPAQIQVVMNWFEELKARAPVKK